MKFKFKDGITIEVEDASSKKEARIQAQKVHDEFVFESTYKIRDTKSVIKKSIKDEYEDAVSLMNYIQELLNKENLVYNDLYYDNNSEQIVISTNNKNDATKLYDFILEKKIADENKVDFDQFISIIKINL